MLGALVGWLLYGGALRAVPARLAAAYPRAYRFTVDKFRVDELYDFLVVRPFEWLSFVLWKLVDSRLIDGTVDGVGKVARWVASIVARVFQNGDVQRYAAVMAIAAAVILGLALGMGGHP